jgi:POT family proton-dependent oligopeptide transporter
MVLGLIQFRLTSSHLRDAGRSPGREKGLARHERIGLAGGAAAVLVVVGLALAGVIKINPVALASDTTKFIVAVAVLYFAWVLLGFDLTKVERQRVGVIVILFISAALFWSGFEQAGSSFNLFADRYTARTVSWLNFALPARWQNYEVAASWFQSLGPIFIITLAPVMAGLWGALARRNLNPSVPVKFGLGLVLLAAGFLVMAGAARLVAAGHKVWPVWLMTTYLVHTFGELCLSPVGLSSVTKLAPRRLVGQMMGTWFLAASLGNLIAGLIAGRFKAEAVEQMPGQYLQLAIVPVVVGLALILLAKPVRKWMAGIQ